MNVTASGSGETPGAAYARTLEHLAYWRHEVDAHADVLAFAASVADIEAAKAAGRLGLIMGFQDTVSSGRSGGRGVT